MKNQENDYASVGIFREYRDEIFKENGDLTVFGGLFFVFFGISLLFAIKKLEKEKNK